MVVVAGPGHLPPRPGGRRRRVVRGRGTGSARSPAPQDSQRRDCRSGRCRGRVARRGRRPGLPRSAAAPTAAGGGILMTIQQADGAALRRHPRHRRPTAPPASIPNAEVVEAIDSSDEWIQQRSGIKQRRWAAPDETVQMMSVARLAGGARARRHRRPSRSTASSSPPSPTCSRRRPSPPPSPTSSAPTRPRPSTSRPPAPASATASRWPPTWSAAAAPATRWSSASSGSPTSPTSTTAARPSSSPTARARRSSARARPRASVRSCGAPTASSST